MGCNLELEPQQNISTYPVTTKGLEDNVTKDTPYIDQYDSFEISFSPFGIQNEIALRKIEEYFAQYPDGKFELDHNEKNQLIDQSQFFRECLKREGETDEAWKLRKEQELQYSRRIENALFQTERPLIFLAMNKLRCTNDDDFSNGAIGLLKALRQFDSTRGFQFSTYAVGQIIYSIRNARNDGSEDLVHPGRASKSRFNKLRVTLEKLYPYKILSDLTQEEIEIAISKTDWGKESKFMLPDTAKAIINTLIKPPVSIDEQVCKSYPNSETFGERLTTSKGRGPEKTLVSKEQLLSLISLLKELHYKGISERDEEIFVSHVRFGETSKNIALRYGLTTTRILQIISKYQKIIQEEFDSCNNF